MAANKNKAVKDKMAAAISVCSPSSPLTILLKGGIPGFFTQTPAPPAHPVSINGQKPLSGNYCHGLTKNPCTLLSCGRHDFCLKAPTHVSHYSNESSIRWREEESDSNGNKTAYRSSHKCQMEACSRQTPPNSPKLDKWNRSRLP